MKQQTTNISQCDIFTIVEKDKKFIIVLGNVRISPTEFKTQKDAEKYIKSKPYELIINTCCYAMTLQNKQNNEKKD